MERVHRIALLVVAVSVAAVLAVALMPGYIISPPDCPLDFRVQLLNTTSGWFYVIEDVQGDPRPLSAYNVTLFTYASGSGSDPVRIVDYEGPLTGVLGAPGNFTFADRGSQPGYVDGYGDYFWTSAWHELWMERSGELVGGTVACA